jgi:hypothetical protein
MGEAHALTDKRKDMGTAAEPSENLIREGLAWNWRMAS